MSKLADDVRAAAVSHMLNVVFGVVEAGLAGWMLFLLGEVVNAWMAFPLPLGVMSGAMGFTGFLVGWFARGAAKGQDRRAERKAFTRDVERKVDDLTPKAREYLKALYETDGFVCDESDGMLKHDDDFDLLGKEGLAERFGARFTGEPQKWRMPADVKSVIRHSRRIRKQVGVE